MNYSEAYLQVPLLLTLSTDAVDNFLPVAAATDAGLVRATYAAAAAART